MREHLRLASKALSRASETRVTTRLQAVRQNLVDAAHKQLAIVRAAALQTFEGIGLPGLPAARTDHDEETLRQAQFALAETWRTLAELEALRGDKSAGVAAYRQALAFEPDSVAAHAQLADLLESSHALADAKTHAERALRADPNNAVAGLALARVLLRQEKFADAERAALAAAEAPRGLADNCALAWALVGEARDRRDDATGAFNAFTQANQIMRRRHGGGQERHHPAHPTNVRYLTQLVERLRPQPAPVAFATPAPAFLIGFPRSGTTLLEQVLATHAGVVCLGETDHLFEAFSVVLKDGDLFDRVSALTAAEIETVRSAYLELVRADAPAAQGKLIVDKHPLHITLLPLINKIWPDAKIVLSLRDPRDVVLSCYQQCFGANVATAQFWALESAADYYDAVMGLMLTCRAKLKLDLHEIEYRDIVADLEREAHAMAAFLGLTFEPAMLRFNEAARARAISSASARQVTEPIYDRSLGRWRRYARELTPVLPLLDKWARRLGYEE